MRSPRIRSSSITWGWPHLGMAYVAAGHLGAAKGSLQKALADDPNFAYAANARETLTKISRGPQ